MSTGIGKFGTEPWSLFSSAHPSVVSSSLSTSPNKVVNKSPKIPTAEIKSRSASGSSNHSSSPASSPASSMQLSPQPSPQPSPLQLSSSPQKTQPESSMVEIPPSAGPKNYLRPNPMRPQLTPLNFNFLNTACASTGQPATGQPDKVAAVASSVFVPAPA